MTTTRSLGVVLALLAAAGSLRILASQASAPAGRGAIQAPLFEVDPLPNHWVLGSTIGLSVANGVDEKINIVLRSTLEVLTSFGDGGRQPGQFFGVHNLDTDSHGNLYATETYTGARVQRFRFTGVGPVKSSQGVPWPRPTE